MRVRNGVKRMLLVLLSSIVGLWRLASHPCRFSSGPCGKPSTAASGPAIDCCQS
jgi:hypothetical protein